jgi:hypothetical protein
VKCFPLFPVFNYFLPFFSNCTVCPPGYICPTTSALPFICGSGTYSIGYATSCTDCPLGTYSNQPGQKGCNICPAGYECPLQTSGTVDKVVFYLFYNACSFFFPLPVPMICPKGTYAPAGSSSCTSCPPGYFCPSTQEVIAYPCNNGTFATGGAHICSVCDVGKQCPFTTLNVEQDCPIGTYSLGGQPECTPCPAGHSCDTAGTNIQPCQPGQYSNEGDGRCTDCPSGFKCPYTNVPDQIPW